MRRVEEVATQMSGATVFSVLDAKSSFWHICLDDKSSKLTTFSTPFGCYRSLRMPFGISSASEVFQRSMEQLFAGYPCAIIVDDIIIGGRDATEHDANLKQVLDRSQDINLKLNRLRCKFRLDQVCYVGHIFTKEGDPAKTVAITNMPVPQDVPAMQGFLGMVNYLGKFIPSLSEIEAPLRQLTQNNTAWCWFPQHQQVFDRLKSCLSSSPVLSCYDVRKPVTLNSDPSCYAQIEKELLAVVFACTKFKDYVYGKPTVTETDHQSLVIILKKPIHTAPARLQRMLLQLQANDITLVYKKGKHMYLADTLSRAPNKAISQSPVENNTFEVMSISYISTNKLKELRTQTAQDQVLQTLSTIISRGWPDKERSVHPSIRSFFPYRDELVVEDGIVIEDHKAVIPHSLH